MPNPATRSTERGRPAAAASTNAADEMSPGTVSSIGVSGPAWISTRVALRRRTGTPIAKSIRSVWSRLGAGSSTVVGPSANRPASNTADLIWPLATGVR